MVRIAANDLIRRSYTLAVQRSTNGTTVIAMSANAITISIAWSS